MFKMEAKAPPIGPGHQLILPDSTTTILSGKQPDFAPAGATGLHISADTGGIDPTFTDLLLSSDNFFLNGSTDAFLSEHNKPIHSFLLDAKPIAPPENFMSDPKSVEAADVLDLTTSTHLLPASTNPTLLGGTLIGTHEESNVVTSTSQVGHSEYYNGLSSFIL